MAPLHHTYGPTCHLARAVTFSGSKGDDDIPAVKVQFFYSSPLPIDDPLTAVPASTAGELKTVKHNPRPFSAYDNNALEEAWLALTGDKDRKNHRKLRNSPLKPLTKSQAERRASIVNELATKHNRKHTKEAPLGASSAGKHDTPQSEAATGGRAGGTAYNPTKADLSLTHRTSDTRTSRDAEVSLNSIVTSHSEEPHHVALDLKVRVCCSELEQDVTAGHRKVFGSVFRRESKAEHARFLRDVMEEYFQQRNGRFSSESEAAKKDSKKAGKESNIESAQSDAAHDISDCDSAGDSDGTDHQKTQTSAVTNAAENVVKEIIQKEHESLAHKASEKHQHSKEHQDFEKHMEADRTMHATEIATGERNINSLLAPGNPDTGTTGSPFARVPARESSTGPSSRPPTPSSAVQGGLDEESASEDHSGRYPGASHRPGDVTTSSLHAHKCKAHKYDKAIADVPVGISRLHLVKLPALQMMPIYWSPVHDIAAVTRATWFYKDTMYPVEVAVANQLEIGYRELRPWSQTWSDELNSAIEVGAAGEEKISHRLWPKETEQQAGGAQDSNQYFMPTDPLCAARCFGGAIAAIGTVDPNSPDEKTSEAVVAPKRFPNSHVIYKDSQNAFILKPSLQPSDYYGRRPLAKIKRGTPIGLHVVRGFDWRAWNKLHPGKKTTSARKAEEVIPVTGNADAGQRTACPACREQEERPRVTDLVLVIHGIGQKLSERVESFHFTHAINAFRRSVNIELGNEAVRNVLRDDLGGIMVLPVNWRSNLSFDPKVSDFSLKDITPETIPAVRSVISEVVMDVPYYMSSHRAAMNEALVTEANRVYRLWCRNNPDFHTAGRVHVIAHSLGSAMAMDVLSKQPTMPRHFDMHSKKIPMKHFDFDTKNLFFAGSPAGLFLLLDKSQLVPRRGRNKPGTDQADDIGPNVTAEAGVFGCLAVDNLYNVIHQNDPIACRLNATVDSLYASSLKNAHIPSATTGWLGAIGNAMRAITPGAATVHPGLGVGQVAKPPVARLPSQLEMEVHDFTREEIAEKKFYLLNDNGQIDYFLSSGGGPLEIQYLNMLSAHSSYWVSPDFVRMLVIEVGRKPGRSNCLPNMKVVKKTAQK